MDATYRFYPLRIAKPTTFFTLPAEDVTISPPPADCDCSNDIKFWDKTICECGVTLDTVIADPEEYMILTIENPIVIWDGFF